MNYDRLRRRPTLHNLNNNKHISNKQISINKTTTHKNYLNLPSEDVDVSKREQTDDNSSRYIFSESRNVSLINRTTPRQYSYDTQMSETATRHYTIQYTILIDDACDSSLTDRQLKTAYETDRRLRGRQSGKVVVSENNFCWILSWTCVEIFWNLSANRARWVREVRASARLAVRSQLKARRVGRRESLLLRSCVWSLSFSTADRQKRPLRLRASVKRASLNCTQKMRNNRPEGLGDRYETIGISADDLCLVRIDFFMRFSFQIIYKLRFGFEIV